MNDMKSVDGLKTEMQKNLSQLRAWRDEVRLKLRLASMEAQDEWQKLEPELAQVERAAEELGDKARDALARALKSLGKMRDSLR